MQYRATIELSQIVGATVDTGIRESYVFQALGLRIRRLAVRACPGAPDKAHRSKRVLRARARVTSAARIPGVAGENPITEVQWQPPRGAGNSEDSP